MAYQVSKSKQEAFDQLKRLIHAFESEYTIYKTLSYSEAQLRIDFINPLLKIFGWDVDNEQLKSQFLREVIQEENINVKEYNTITKKNPDYTLRVQGIRKLFVEAKKVAINLDKSNKAAFQTRRYGWNANLGASILTNFENIIIYDCRYKPNVTDTVYSAKYKSFHFTQFLENFDDLWLLFSYQSVASGYIDDIFSVSQKDTTTFDSYFLIQIENWRRMLAADIIENNINIESESINFLIHRLLNRIIFLRICEDREIEKYETLKKVKNYNELKDIFILADKKYNSGLFDFIEDNFSLQLRINSNTLISIFNELYYPESPYDFSVVDSSILSQIYERYLGSRISISEKQEISIIEEPEVAASNGVVPTPKLIAKNIVKETLDPLFVDKTLAQIQQLKIADICCGSGIFIISVFDYLLEKYINLLSILSNVNDDILYKRFDGSLHLSLKEKHKILTENIFGVDINPYAVEVTKFSILLKLLENEDAGSINNFLKKYGTGVLPNLDNNIKCGNSLIDDNYLKCFPEAINDNDLLFEIKPFNWNLEFSFFDSNTKFDAIVGNPPYVRIQNLAKYSEKEILYFQNRNSNYSVAKADAFDKYYLFIQRAIELLNNNGVLGYIVPHKFFIVKSGRYLRSFITQNASILKIIHFGISQVFPNRSTYTTIIILDKKYRTEFFFKRINVFSEEFMTGQIVYDSYKSSLYTEHPWVFVSKEITDIFNKLHGQDTEPLHSVAQIAVGLQTSADKIYIFQPINETVNTYYFKLKDTVYEIEKEICKPCLYDLSFGLFDTVSPNAQIIFPYFIQDGNSEVFSEEYFQKQYPLAWEYLKSQKDFLEKRSINGGKHPKWYQFGRSQSLTKFQNADKLIWPVLSTGPSYILDDKNLQFTGGGNGPYYSLLSKSRYSLYYILAILLHPVVEAMIKAQASEFRGAYYSHGKQFIENLPIKIINFKDAKEKKQYDDIEKTVRELIKTKQIIDNTVLSSKRNILFHKMDILRDSLVKKVNALYGITEEDLEKIQNDEMLNSNLN